MREREGEMILQMNSGSIGKITIPQCINLVRRKMEKQGGGRREGKKLGAI
jgi:hypothetical protein